MRKNGKWKIVNSKTKYKSPWLEVVEDRVVQPDGKKGIYGVVKAKKGVAVLPVDDEGYVYLIKEFRYPLGNFSIEAAGGGIDKNEKSLEIAKRELKEEMGITAKKWRRMGEVRPLTAYIDCPNTLYIAKDLKFGPPSRDPNEEMTLIKLSLEKAVKMVQKGQITEQRTCILILMAKFLD